jgi:hypothetical protein
VTTCRLLWFPLVISIQLALSAALIAQLTVAPGSPFPVEAYPQLAAVGDFNGDGKPYLVIASNEIGYRGVTVLLGDGTGQFTAAPGGSAIAVATVRLVIQYRP